MNRSVLSTEEIAILIPFLKLQPQSTEHDVARAFAQNYWHNHAKGMKDGDPLDVPGVRMKVLQSVINHFQEEFCPNAKV